MFFASKLKKRLSKIGNEVSIKYCVIINNNPPLDFSSPDELKRYVIDYREHNAIFNLIMYRIEIYSL